MVDNSVSKEQFLQVRHYFKTEESFEISSPYKLLPFNFHSLDKSSVFISNIAGENTVIPAEDFKKFCDHELNPTTETFKSLKSKHFLMDSDHLLPVELLALKLRTKIKPLSDFLKNEVRNLSQIENPYYIKLRNYYEEFKNRLLKTFVE